MLTTSSNDICLPGQRVVPFEEISAESHRVSRRISSERLLIRPSLGGYSLGVPEVLVIDHGARSDGLGIGLARPLFRFSSSQRRPGLL